MLFRKTEKRIKEIRQRIYSNATAIEDLACFETQAHLPAAEAMSHKGYKPCRLGRRWGRPWGTAWFRLRFSIPRPMRGKAVSLRFDSGGESVVFYQGAPWQGLDRNRDELRLTERAKGAERYEMFVESGASGAFGQFKAKNVLTRAELCTVNKPVWECWHALSFLRLLALELPENSPRRRRLIRAVNRAVDAFDYLAVDEEALSRSARAALAEVAEVRSRRAEPSMPTAHLIGHAHIDVAWLWPMRETIRKCARTFSTAVKYLEEYPEYRFSQSQAQLYAFTKERYPALYEKIKKRVKEGRWEPVGGMWVEADCNLASGESLVRQILYGRRFFEEEFGTRSETVWLPDVFGYSAAMPQIIRQCDMKHFLTQKLSWNDTNRMPYSTFWWRGIDGSEVLTHFPPADTYNGRMNPASLHKAVRQLAESDRSDDLMYVYGFGDGGGGPTKEMLEYARVGADLEGCPRLKPATADEFFHKLERDSRDLPTWVGELYFEYHRGTYTTQAANKKNNRRSEFLMREAELASAIGLLQGRAYPQDDLSELWRAVLCNQFHDIIPGSSIRAVYEDSAAHYAAIMPRMKALRDEALRALADTVDTRGEGAPIFVFNPLSWSRTDIAEAPLPASLRQAAVVDCEGKPTPCEIVGEGRRRRIRFLARGVPGMGYAVFRVARGAPADETPDLAAGARRLENCQLRVQFDRHGRIRSIYDKAARREIVPEGKRANALQVFEDKPTAFDAWDIEVFYQDKGYEAKGLESFEVVSRGPLEAAVRQRRRFGKSRIEQVIALRADSRRIDFHTRVDWRENEQLLKAAFPTTLNPGAPARATFEIQYGHIERPTHWNTSWDRARFETCGHKWADLAESDYGVALLNDCKYGHDVKDAQLRLTLLRATKYPDPKADIGQHEFSYALMPHQGDLRQAGLIREGYGFNVPLIAFLTDKHAGRLPARRGFFAVDAANVIIEAVKKAEHSGDVIVRLYEAHNAGGRATLTLPRAPKDVWECNLVERDLRRQGFEGARVAFDIKPFEIKTFRARF